MSDSNPGGTGKLWEAIELWEALGGTWKARAQFKTAYHGLLTPKAANLLEVYVAKRNQPKGALLRSGPSAQSVTSKR